MALQMSVKDGINYILENSGKHNYNEKIDCVESFLKKFPHSVYGFGEVVYDRFNRDSSYKRYTIIDYTNRWFTRLAVFEVDGILYCNILKQDGYNLDEPISTETAMELLERYYNLDTLFPYDKYWDMIDHFPTWERERKKLDEHQFERQRILKILGFE